MSSPISFKTYNCQRMISTMSLNAKIYKSGMRLLFLRFCSCQVLCLKYFIKSMTKGLFNSLLCICKIQSFTSPGKYFSNPGLTNISLKFRCGRIQDNSSKIFPQTLETCQDNRFAFIEKLMLHGFCNLTCYKLAILQVQVTLFWIGMDPHNIKFDSGKMHSSLLIK